MASPISLESPARQFQELRSQTQKLFFSVGDKVYTLHRGRPKNGVIKNYNGRERRPYEVFFYNGDIGWYSVCRLFNGNVEKGSVVKQNNERVSLRIIECDPPILVGFH